MKFIQSRNAEVMARDNYILSATKTLSSNPCLMLSLWQNCKFVQKESFVMLSVKGLECKDDWRPNT